MFDRYEPLPPNASVSFTGLLLRASAFCGVDVDADFETAFDGDSVAPRDMLDKYEPLPPKASVSVVGLLLGAFISFNFQDGFEASPAPFDMFDKYETLPSNAAVSFAVLLLLELSLLLLEGAAARVAGVEEFPCFGFGAVFEGLSAGEGPSGMLVENESLPPNAAVSFTVLLRLLLLLLRELFVPLPLNMFDK